MVGRFVFGVCLSSICCSGVAFAAEVHVHPGGSIQSAIDGASNGDVVTVHPGTYGEAIRFYGKAITVRSTDPDSPATVESTVIDSSGLETSTVMFVDGEGRESVLLGLTITGGVGNELFTSEIVGGGIMCDSTSPTIDGCLVRNNSAVGGGGIFGRFSDPLVVNSRVESNTASTGIQSYDGGGGLNFFGGDPEIVHTIIVANEASSDGGGITILGGDLSMSNCLVLGNTAAAGGGICVLQSQGEIDHCTIVSNNANGPADYGAGARNDLGSYVTYTNCISWENWSWGGVSEIRDSIDSGSTVNNSCIRFGWWSAGSNNIGDGLHDPDLVFVDYDNGDYRLRSDSICLDMGTAEAASELDLDGNPRLVGSAVDMGAYELQSTPPPPVADGACCVDGACVVMTAADCASAGGTYQGDDTPCDGVCIPPAATGACCLGAVCSVLTFDECEAQGGLYQGDDAPCGGDTCFVPDPTGACCFADGTCGFMSAGDCAAEGGTYGGDDVPCLDANCPQPPPPGGEGACCFSTGFCLIAEADMCVLANGTFLGEGTTCSGSDPCGGDGEPEPCPADLDASAEVEFHDLLLLLSDWGACPGCAADLDGNDDVGMTDLIQMLVEWGPCPS